MIFSVQLFNIGWLNDTGKRLMQPARHWNYFTMHCTQRFLVRSRCKEGVRLTSVPEICCTLAFRWRWIAVFRPKSKKLRTFANDKLQQWHEMFLLTTIWTTQLREYGSMLDLKRRAVHSGQCDALQISSKRCFVVLNVLIVSKKWK